MKKLIILSVILVTLLGCVNKQRETELLKKIAELENQLDECRYGAEKIHTKMKLSYEQKDYKTCKKLYKEMEQRHLDSELFSEVEAIYDKVVKAEKEKTEKERLLAEKKNNRS